jgi:hypothetical protein
MATQIIPEKLNLGREYDYNMDTLLTHYDKHLALIASHEQLDTVRAERYACGFPLPPFQRPLVWTRAQEVLFIESAWLGLYIGTYCTHDIDWEHDGTVKAFSGWLLDGQQRLTTFQRYWNSEFKVFGRYYSELTRKEKHRFSRIPFKQSKVILDDEALIKELYNRMAFGGVAHTADDFAV